jgi:hypothetical protein
MSDTIVLQVTPARTLLTMYRWRASRTVDEVETLGRVFATAAPFLGVAGADDPTPRALGHLTALGEQLQSDHDDLAWRVAYVEALGTDGMPTRIPLRRHHLQGASVIALVAMLDGDDADAALAELMIRAVRDPEASRAIADALGADGVEALRDDLHHDMVAVALGYHLHPSTRHAEGDDSMEAVASGFDERLQIYGALLASFSHHDEGRAVLEEVFHLASPDSSTNFLPVALLHGDWEETFLSDLYERVFDSPSDFWGGFGRLTGAMGLIEGELLFPRLTDPHTVLLEAIGRQPELARRLVFEGDAFRRLMEFDDYGAFGGYDVGSGDQSRMQAGSRLGDGLAALFEAALVDPGNTEAIFAFLGGGSRIDERGFEVHIPGLFHDIAELGLPRSPELRQVLADVWNLQWHNLAHLGNDVRPTDDVGGAVLAEIFQNETARLEVMAGFGAYVEILYAGAFAEGGDVALDRAGVGTLRAFQHIDHALDELQPSSTDRSLLRSAFRAGAGHGARQLVPWLAGPKTWATVAAGFVVSETLSAIADVALPDDRSQYPTSRSVLHDLFVAEPEHSGPPLPTTAEVIFANAAMAAHPDLAADVEASRWLVDGVIVPPSGDDAAALDDYGFWFGRNFTGDAALQPLVTAPARDIANWLATEEFLES